MLRTDLRIDFRNERFGVAYHPVQHGNVVLKSASEASIHLCAQLSRSPGMGKGIGVYLVFELRLVLQAVLNGCPWQIRHWLQVRGPGVILLRHHQTH